MYSPAQLSIAQLFANWMQASYLPKGALGDVLQIRNAKLSPYNQNTAAHAQRLRGTRQALHATDIRREQEDRAADERQHELGHGSQRVLTGSPWTPSARRERYYFTLPTFEQQGYGTELDKAADVSRHPVLKQFPTRFVRDSSTGNKRLVVLTKDRRHPFVTVTKGEYLQALEAAVLRKYD